MSVTTTADEKRRELQSQLRSIRQYLKAAENLAAEMINENTWGGQDWSEEFVRETIDLIHFMSEVELKLRFWKHFGG